MYWQELLNDKLLIGSAQSNLGLKTSLKTIFCFVGLMSDLNVKILGFDSVSDQCVRTGTRNLRARHQDLFSTEFLYLDFHKIN